MQNGLVATFDLKPRSSCHMLRLDRHAPTRLLVSATAVVLLTILSTLAAAAIVHYPASVRWITAGAAVLITYIQLHTWRARLDHIPLAAIVLVALNVVAILGQLFYRRVADVAAVSATLSTDAAVYRNAAVIFAAASLAFWIGGPAGTIGVERGAPVQRSDHGEMLTPVARPKVFPTMMASSIPLVLGVIGFSVHGLLRRPNYLHTFGPTVFVKLAYILVPMGLAGAALLLFNGQQRGEVWRALSSFALFGLSLLDRKSGDCTCSPPSLRNVLATANTGRPPASHRTGLRAVGFWSNSLSVPTTVGAS